MSISWNTGPLNRHRLDSDIPKQKLTIVTPTDDCVIWKGEKLRWSDCWLTETIELRSVLKCWIPKQGHTYVVLDSTVLVLGIRRQQQVRNLRWPVQICDHSVDCVIMIDKGDSVGQNVVFVSKFYLISTFILIWNRLWESTQAYRHLHDPKLSPKTLMIGWKSPKNVLTLPKTQVLTG